MSIIRTGERRSLSIVVHKMVNHVEVGTGTTYNGLLAFNNFPEITTNDLALLSFNDYLLRLDAFKTYVSILEPDIDFIHLITEPYYNYSGCTPLISYEGVFEVFDCELVSDVSTYDYTFQILGVSTTNRGISSTYYTDLVSRVNLVTNAPLEEKYVYNIGFKITTTLENDKIAPEFNILFTSLDGVRYDYSLFNLKIMSSNTAIISQIGVNLYGNNSNFIRQTANVLTYTPETNSSVNFSGDTLTRTYSIKFLPYVFGNINTNKNVRVSILPTNSNGNYTYNYSSNNYVDLGFNYSENTGFCNVSAEFVGITTPNILITNNGVSNLFKIFDDQNNLIASIPVTPYSGLITIPLLSYGLTTGIYNLILYNPNNSVYKLTTLTLLF